MAEVTIQDAEAQLAQLIERVEAGEEITIVREREAVARLLPAKRTRPKRVPGRLKDQVHVPDSFFDPLPPGELDAWGQV